jgi:hypothetical protein
MDHLGSLLPLKEKTPSSEPLFHAIVPVRFYGSDETTKPEMPVPLGLATGKAVGQILKMGGVCKRWFGRRYGLQMFFFP